MAWVLLFSPESHSSPVQWQTAMAGGTRWSLIYQSWCLRLIQCLYHLDNWIGPLSATTFFFSFFTITCRWQCGWNALWALMSALRECHLESGRGRWVSWRSQGAPDESVSAQVSVCSSLPIAPVRYLCEAFGLLRERYFIVDIRHYFISSILHNPRHIDILLFFLIELLSVVRVPGRLTQLNVRPGSWFRLRSWCRSSWVWAWHRALPLAARSLLGILSLRLSLSAPPLLAFCLSVSQN